MSTLQEQLVWEQETINRGSQRYDYKQDRLKESGQGDRADIGFFLIRDKVDEIAQLLEVKANKTTGVGGKSNKVLKQAAVNGDYTRMSYIAIQVIIQQILKKKKLERTGLLNTIAVRIETDLKCFYFESKMPDYYKTVMNSLKDQNVQDYDHKHKVFMKKFQEFELEWEPWSPQFKMYLASKILEIITLVFEDVFKWVTEWKGNKSIKYLAITEEFYGFIKDFEMERGLLLPVHLPLKIKPLEWTNQYNGGYYNPILANSIKFIKTKSKEHREFIKGKKPKKHIKAINKLQNTAWRINRRVLEIQEEIYKKGLQIGLPSNQIIKPPVFPEHLDKDKELYTEKDKQDLIIWKIEAKQAYYEEQQRIGKVIALAQTQELAREIKNWDEFYYVYYCDFRGRVYCATSSLSPQGSDIAKGILEFAHGVELGEDGVKWLAINGANKYGYDKVTYKERIKWVNNRREEIELINQDPITYRHLWAEADKPYQYLAFCFEWAACGYGTDKNYISRIPVGLDGTCNGLQHFSAMLRDPVGAKATNLIDTEKPQDIYDNVASVCMDKLRAMNSDNPLIKKWIEVGVDRKCTKRPVMTLPYGSTRTSAQQYILEYVIENWDKFKLDKKFQWETAKILTPILWDSIGEVVVGARKVMDWLRKNLKKELVTWETPLGFPILQPYKKVDAIRIKTQLCGEIEILYRDFDNGNGKANIQQQKNGISPNFVHSLDSTHMIMTILNSDIEDFAMVHDDFGTHAGNTQYLFEKIRESFYELYTKHNPLQEFADQQEIENTLELGEYNLGEIFNAEYFFG